MPSDLKIVISSVAGAARDAAEHDLAQLAGDVRLAEPPFADALHDVAGFDERGRARIDEQAGRVATSSGAISR